MAITIESWQKLVEVAEHLEVGDGLTRPYMFRGHESSDWKLEPTLHRAATLYGTRPLPNATTLLRFEDEVTKRFKQAAANHLSAAILASTNLDVEWWPIMRHYGAPTRLLDWTASIFVAAYFACRGEPKKDGSIYLLHTHTLDVAMGAIHEDFAGLEPS